MISKIKSREELQEIIKELKYKGKKIVHTNGTYDILHVGHIRTLQAAKAMGDVLIVSINSDESVKKFKGTNRPILDQEERAILLSALECVDYVTIFPEDDILKTLALLRPDIQVKGGTFIPDRVKAERDLVESCGGIFRFLPILDGKSTTNIIERILRTQK